MRKGRTARRLRTMLESLGFEIRMLVATRGACRWFAAGDRVAMGRFMATVDGWDTMTDCVRRGIIITQDMAATSFSVHAREPGDTREPKAAWENFKTNK